MMQKTNLRTFLRRSVLLSATMSTAWGAAAGDSAEKRAVRLGGPVFSNSDDPELLARAHRQLSYSAAYCPPVSLDDGAAIRAYENAFRRAGVVIAEVGRWVNLMDADAQRRRANFRKVVEGLALADEIGALCCVDIAGSHNPDVWYGPHPDNLSREFFAAAVENARKILDEVRPKRAKFCYEMMGWALPDTPQSYRRMIRAVDRRGFGVHLDPCNLINSPRKFYENTALLHECFELLGSHIVSCHAKDLQWRVEMNVHFVEVIPGTGNLDYRTYLKLLARLPQRPPLMLEHLKSAEEYDRARRYLLDQGGSEGVKFG